MYLAAGINQGETHNSLLRRRLIEALIAPVTRGFLYRYMMYEEITFWFNFINAMRLNYDQLTPPRRPCWEYEATAK